MKLKLILFICLLVGYTANSQTNSALDSTLKEQTEAIKILKKVKLSGYLQPQFQYAQEKGIKYHGGDFGTNVDNRFTLRRARLKTSYSSNNFEVVLVTENTERSFSLHDMYASYTMKNAGLVYTVGLFPRPFGFEQNFSSGKNEGPERARFSPILLPAEADLGFTLSYIKLNPVTIELGMFNGNSTASDFDSYKDFIARVSFDTKIKSDNLSGGVSFYQGGVMQGNNRLFEMDNVNNAQRFVLQDTLVHLKGNSATRQYVGADVQYTFSNVLGQTTLRTEWMSGTQPGSSTSSDSPKSSVAPTYDTYSRKFNALSSYFIHKIGKTNFQLMVKYDWYDPNTDADADDIGIAGSNLNATDIKFSTLGLGLNYYYKNMTIVFYYDVVTNEKATHLAGYENDIKDNVFTLRTQFKI
jgi:hypothetical protein